MAKRKLENLPGNSNSRKAAPIRTEARRIEEETPATTPQDIVPSRRPIVAKRGQIKKRSLTQKIARSFAGNEAQGVVDYIIHDVLVPAAKNTIQEMFSSGIEMFLYGERRPSSRSRDRDRGKSHISYGEYYRESELRRSDAPRRRTARPRDRFGLEDIYFKHGEDASEVLEALCDELEKYETVSVATYFELAGIDGATWAHDRWGWDDLSKAYCSHTRGGYVIVLPEPSELE